jgi:hypothetical protein
MPLYQYECSQSGRYDDAEDDATINVCLELVPAGMPRLHHRLGDFLVNLLVFDATKRGSLS